MSNSCNGCQKENHKLSDENLLYVVHEAEMARSERYIKRLWIALILAFSLLFVSNCIWIYAWCLYDYESIDIMTDNNSNANYIGQDGNIYNGSTDHNQEENEK